LLEQLGRYEEVIDWNLKHFNEKQYYVLTNARYMAKKYVPHRQKEIAQIVIKK
jgi:hypothetical protein